MGDGGEDALSSLEEKDPASLTGNIHPSMRLPGPKSAHGRGPNIAYLYVNSSLRLHYPGVSKSLYFIDMLDQIGL